MDMIRRARGGAVAAQLREVWLTVAGLGCGTVACAQVNGVVGWACAGVSLLVLEWRLSE